MANYVYSHLKTPSNQGGGLADYILFAPVYDFSTIGCPPATGAAPGDLVTVVDAHTFPVGKGFLKAICSPFKNNLKAAAVGDIGSQKFEEKLEVFLPGSYAELHETLMYLKNTPCIVLVKDANCVANMYYQLGCDCLYAWASAEFDSADVKGGQKGYKITFTYYSDAVILYDAVVTEKP